MLRGLFVPQHTVEITQSAGKTGSVFTESLTDTLTMERWVLRKGYRPPNVEQVVLAAPADPSADYASVCGFLAAVGPTFENGYDTYVKALASIRSDGIPPTPVPPEAPTPPVGGAKTELYDGVHTLFLGSAGVPVGWAYAQTVAQGQSQEYWVFLQGYAAPSKDAGVLLVAGGLAVATLDDFLTYQRKTWVDGNTFMMVTANSYTAIPADNP